MGDKAGLIDGMNVTAIISLQKATVPAVPAEALVTMQGQDYIFMVTVIILILQNNKHRKSVLKLCLWLKGQQK